MVIDRENLTKEIRRAIPPNIWMRGRLARALMRGPLKAVCDRIDRAEADVALVRGQIAGVAGHYIGEPKEAPVFAYTPTIAAEDVRLAQ